MLDRLLQLIVRQMKPVSDPLLLVPLDHRFKESCRLAVGQSEVYKDPLDVGRRTQAQSRLAFTCSVAKASSAPW